MDKKKAKRKSADDALTAGANGSAPSTSAAIGGAAAGGAVTDSALIERAFQAGNYADVRRLAATDTSARARELLLLTHIDKGQVVVGLIAVVVVLVAAAMTLR